MLALVGKAELQVLLWFAAIVVALLVVVWLARLPGARARRRYHPNAGRIALLGWVGVVVWPVWIVAYALSSRRPGLSSR